MSGKTTFTAFLVALSWSVAAIAQPFPGQLPGEDLSAGLPAAFEASGISWHPRLARVFVCSDGGQVVSMEANGTLPKIWGVPGDLEATAIADPATDFLYFGNELPARIMEWNFVTGQVTRVFDVAPFMTFDPSKGLEGLGFLPDAADPEGGVFLAGKQADGKIYRFRLPIKSSSTSTAVTFLGTWTPVPGRANLRSVEYDPVADCIWLGWVEPNFVSRISRDGALIQEWQMVLGKPEGLAVRSCELFAADDDDFPHVVKYSAFPSPEACAAIAADVAKVSVASGGNVDFVLRAQAPLGPGSVYLLAGSASGTTPALQLGGVTLALVPDAWFSLTLSAANTGALVETFGTFAPDGFAHPRIAVPGGLPPVVVVGLHLHHAWIGATSLAGYPIYASPPVALEFVP